MRVDGEKKHDNLFTLKAQLMKKTCLKRKLISIYKRKNKDAFAEKFRLCRAYSIPKGKAAQIYKKQEKAMKKEKVQPGEPRTPLKRRIPLKQAIPLGLQHVMAARYS